MLSRASQLEYFIAVAEEGQITRAARRLKLAQPVLSQALANLEAEVGVELFKRNARGVTLTAAGKAFLVDARRAFAAEIDAARTAQALARAGRGVIAVGFVGPPPPVSDPELFASFREAHPEIEVSFQDLPFPRGATADWLAEVDIALCHAPLAEEGIRIHPVRVEPRAILAHRSHPLARRLERAHRLELAVADVLDETYVGYHPSVQPGWAGFHSLDDHRGGPPEHLTSDHAQTTLHMFAIMTSGRAVTAVPQTDANLAKQVAPDVAVMRLSDADPARVSLIWRGDEPNPHVAMLVATAERLSSGADAV
jgi:DNA-binding transcriptional LysR family regulator